MRRCLLLVLCLTCVSSLLTAKNLFEPAGFETWSQAKNLPSDVDWRWAFAVEGKDGFTAFEQSDEVVHSGKYSLHVKDEVGGNLNHSFWYQISADEIAPWRGKTLCVGAWVKLISASQRNTVGIAFSVGAASGSVSGSAAIDETSETEWKFLMIKVNVPSDADGAQLFFNCANGWGNKAEAYFDDIIVGEDPDEAEKASALEDVQTVEKPAPDTAVQSEPGCFFPMFPPPEGMHYMLHGGWEIVKEAENADDYVELKATVETQEFSAFLVYTDTLTGTYDILDVKPEDLWIECVLDCDTAVQLRLADMEPFAWFGKGKPLPDGRYLYDTRGQQIATDALLKSVRGVNLQFCMKMPAGTHVKIYGLRINAPGNPPAPRHGDLPDIADIIKKYKEPEVVTSDNYERPVIKDGTFYMNGKYHFLRGPWIYPRWDDWQSWSNPLNIQHIAYTTPPGKLVFDAVGFNTCQPSGAPPLPGQIRHGLPIPVYVRSRETDIQAYFKNLKDIPFILDFAFGYNLELKKYQPDEYRRLNQKTGEWHEFIPFCPEDPEGNRYYEDYFIAGTVSALSNGANPYAYELFNESSYNCQCSYNIRAFAQAMKNKFVTIEKANEIWHTAFGSFDELAAQTLLQQYPRLWPDWCIFASQRYADKLRHFADVIRTVDKRPNVYFTEQCGGAPPVHPAMDYRMIADACDILAMEGGMRFGYANSGVKAKSAGAEILVSSNERLYLTYLFYQALAKNQKPIVNNENNSIRGELGVRIPSKRSDMITALWTEVIHGSSSTNFYVWDKRSWEWQTFEQAVQNGSELNSCKASSYLNPYCWDPKDLDAPKDFAKEFEPYADKIMPMPRVAPGNVAFFHPQASVRMMPFLKYDFERYMPPVFGTLFFKQYNIRVVFDEEILAGLDGVDAIVFPISDYIDPALFPALTDFTKRGGLILADYNAFAMDERGNTIASLPFPVTRFDGRTAQGRAILVQACEKAGIKRTCTLTPARDDSELSQVDLQLINRGDFKLLYLFSGISRLAEMATIHLNLNEDATNKYYVQNIVTHRLIMNENQETWSVADLKSGLPLMIPPQERIVLVLTQDKPSGASPITAAEMATLAEARNIEDAPYWRAFAVKEEAIRNRETSARSFTDVRTEACTTIDMSTAFNSTFHDDYADDKISGWFDQGSMVDLRNIPRGKQTFAGVPFFIADGRQSNTKDVVVLGSLSREYLPKSALVKLAQPLPAKRIYFLHTCGWGGGEGLALKYVVKYTDSTQVEIPIHDSQEICEWCGGFIIPNAKIAVETEAEQRKNLTMYCYRWDNPHPSKKIATIDIVSGWQTSVPAVAAITFEN